MKNLKTTLFMPILKSIKYFFMYILLFLIPFIVLIFIFYLLQNFKNSFTILQFILGLTIFLTTLAIIAKLFNVDNKSSDLCLELISNKEKDVDGFLNNFFNKIKILICLVDTDSSFKTATLYTSYI
mgnify:CR=1 FL=1